MRGCQNFLFIIFGTVTLVVLGIILLVLISLCVIKGSSDCDSGRVASDFAGFNEGNPNDTCVANATGRAFESPVVIPSGSQPVWCNFYEGHTGCCTQRAVSPSEGNELLAKCSTRFPCSQAYYDVLCAFRCNFYINQSICTEFLDRTYKICAGEQMTIFPKGGPKDCGTIDEIFGTRPQFEAELLGQGHRTCPRSECPDCMNEGNQMRSPKVATFILGALVVLAPLAFM